MTSPPPERQRGSKFPSTGGVARQRRGGPGDMRTVAPRQHLYACHPPNEGNVFHPPSDGTGQKRVSKRQSARHGQEIALTNAFVPHQSGGAGRRALGRSHVFSHHHLV